MYILVKTNTPEVKTQIYFPFSTHLFCLCFPNYYTTLEAYLETSRLFNNLFKVPLFWVKIPRLY